MKQEFAEFKERVDEIEKQLSQTTGRVEGVLNTGALVECSACQALVRAGQFPTHWIQLHSPPPEVKKEEIPLNAERFEETMKELTKEKKWTPEEVEAVKRVYEYMVSKKWVKE